jgi:hypothetical protein
MASRIVEVDAIREQLNHSLEGPAFNQDHKQGICFALEAILMRASKYKGFGYLVPGLKPENEFSRVYY